MNRTLCTLTLCLGLTGTVQAVNYKITCINNTDIPVTVWSKAIIDSSEKTFTVGALSTGALDFGAACPRTVRVLNANGLVREFQFKGQACGNKKIFVNYDAAGNISASSDTPEGIIGAYQS